MTLNLGDKDITVVKYNSIGVRVWRKHHAGSREDIAHKVIETSDGNYIIVGHSRSTDATFAGFANIGDQDGFVLKIDNTGTKIWIKSLGGAFSDFAYDAIDFSNKILVVGHTSSNNGEFENITGKGDEDGFVAEFNYNGTLNFIKKYGGSEIDKFLGITKANDNGVIIVGSANSDNGFFKDLNKGLYDAVILKFGGEIEEIPPDLLEGVLVNVGISESEVSNYAGFSVKSKSHSAKNLGSMLVIYKDLLEDVDSTIENKSLVRMNSILDNIDNPNSFRLILRKGINKIYVKKKL